jgi:glycosyltransferase involved in cell wall biosynthesis
VVDTGSCDETVSLVQPSERLGVSVMRNATNEGFARAHNKAIAAADSEFILALNTDVLLAPEAVAYHVRCFRPGERDLVPVGVRRHAVKNRWLMLVKSERPSLFLKHLPRIIVYNITILAYLVVFERSSLVAITDFLRLLPEVLERRRKFQGCRKVHSKYMGKWFN